MKLTYGYDRHERSWCIILEDENGYELESHYLGTKKGCDSILSELKKEYKIADADVKKYKAY